MATPYTPLPVRYNPILSWGMLALGLINLVLGLWLLALGVPAVSLLLGLVLTLLGVLYLRRDYFTFTPGTRTVEVIAPLGTRRSYKPGRDEGLTAQGGRILITRSTGKPKRLPVFRYMSRRADWDTVIAAIQSR